MSEADEERARLAEDIRRLLGVDVEFEKLSVDDLRRLLVILTNLRRLAAVGAHAVRRRLKTRVNTMLNMRLGDMISDDGLLAELSKDNGPLGLGILPALVGRGEEPEPSHYRRARRRRTTAATSGQEAPGAEGEAEQHADHG